MSAPVFYLLPYNLAGNTFVSLSTKVSPLLKYSIMSLKSLCSISPVFLWRTMSLHSSRHLGGSVAIFSDGRLNWNCESFICCF